MKKRIPAAICAALMVFALIVKLNPAQGAWDDGLIFIALNDQPLTLSGDTMPILVNNTPYVPYTIFDSNINGGINLGIYIWGQNKTQNTLTMYSAERNLVFDLNTGLSYDSYGGEEQRPRAVIRNGRIYLSASSLCSYFRGEDGTWPRYYYTVVKNYGYPLLRISNGDAKLNDQGFVNSASTTSFLNILNTYYSSLNPQASPSVSPTTAIPTVPVPTPTPSDEGKRDVKTYLAVRCDTGEATAQVLDALRDDGRAALLFFSPDRLAGQDDLIRRAVGEGHVIGLLAEQDTAEAALSALEEGNRLLSHIALTETRIVLCSGGDAVSAALYEDGWLCWEGSVDGVPAGRTGSSAAAAALTALSAQQRTARITTDDSTEALQVLTRVLRAIREDQYDYRLAVETEF